MNVHRHWAGQRIKSNPCLYANGTKLSDTDNSNTAFTTPSQGEKGKAGGRWGPSLILNVDVTTKCIFPTKNKHFLLIKKTKMNQFSCFSMEPVAVSPVT